MDGRTDGYAKYFGRRCWQVRNGDGYCTLIHTQGLRALSIGIFQRIQTCVWRDRFQECEMPSKLFIILTCLCFSRLLYSLSSFRILDFIYKNKKKIWQIKEICHYLKSSKLLNLNFSSFSYSISREEEHQWAWKKKKHWKKKMGRYSGKTARLSCMLFLTSTYFLVEIIVGYVTNSMALVADSFHMLSDVLALVIGLFSGTTTSF